ncbi:hypothetical protein GGI09_000434 [Coemansia sp. S100]|nr:hypothetical protein GGI09_000434 [Coemansia sp. S100]
MGKPKILVIYYSTYGHVQTIAQAEMREIASKLAAPEKDLSKTAATTSEKSAEAVTSEKPGEVASVTPTSATPVKARGRMLQIVDKFKNLFKS